MSFVVPDGFVPSDNGTVIVLGMELRTWWNGLSLAQRMSVYALAQDAWQRDQPVTEPFKPPQAPTPVPDLTRSCPMCHGSGKIR